MENQLTVGSIVRLKTGGPDMTVSVTKTAGGHVRAVYYNFENCRFQYEEFELGTLIVLSEETTIKGE